MNQIKDAFVFRERARHYSVLEGCADEERGFLAGEFTTRKEAREFRDKINTHIKTNPETYDLALTRAEDSEGVQKPFGLYLVTFTRKREGKRPLVFSVHCLAPDERGAILQTENLAFPDSGPLLDEEQRASLSATASRVPFYIRGWSANTF